MGERGGCSAEVCWSALGAADAEAGGAEPLWPSAERGASAQERPRRAPWIALCLAATLCLAAAGLAVRWRAGGPGAPAVALEAPLTWLQAVKARALEHPPGTASEENGGLFLAAAEMVAEVAISKQWVIATTVHVRQSASLHAHIVESFDRCTVVLGRELESNWIELIGGAGFIKRRLDGAVLADQLVFQRVPGGSLCADYYLFEVDDPENCRVAADGLGLQMFNITQETGKKHERHELLGCQAADGVVMWLSADSHERSTSPFGGRQRICATQPPCSTRDRTTVKASRSTSLSSTKAPRTTTSTTLPGDFPANLQPVRFPTLYCWMLVTFQGYEPELVKEQYHRGLGVFRCDGYALFSHDQTELADGIMTRGLGGDSVSEVGSWGSWSNSKLFLGVWRQIIQENEYKNFGFVVKVDPDTVFHPSRLKLHVQDVSAGSKVYMQNCIGYPTIGALEVFTRAAVAAYADSIQGGLDATDDSHQCHDLLWNDGQATAEDYFICNCMERLGVEKRRDLKLLRHEKPGGCDDKWIVAFHPYKGVKNFTQCALAD